MLSDGKLRLGVSCVADGRLRPCGIGISDRESARTARGDKTNSSQPNSIAESLARSRGLREGVAKAQATWK